MFEPEQATTPSVLILSMMPSAVPDDAGPTIASTLSEVTSVSSELVATSGLVPSSACLSTIGLPFTPPSALISATAIVTGVERDLMIADRSPDCGRSAPSTSWPLMLPRSPEDPAVVELPGLATVFLLLLHADATIASVATSAIATSVLLRAIWSPGQIRNCGDKPYPGCGEERVPSTGIARDGPYDEVLACSSSASR